MLVPKLVLSPVNEEEVLAVKEIALVDHQILLDGKAVETYREGKRYFWQRQNENREVEEGVLNLFYHGLMGRGVVRTNGKVIAFKASALIDYELTVDNEEWIHLEVGFTPDDDGNWHAFGQFMVPGHDDQTQLINDSTTLTFVLAQDEQQHEILSVQFESSQMLCSYKITPWICGDLLFSMNYSTITGHVSEYNPEDPSDRSKLHDVRGTYCDPTHVERLKNSVKAYAALKPAQGPGLKSASAKIPESLMGAITLKGAVGLSVEELFTIPTPDMDNLHELSFAKLKNLMLYAIPDEQRQWYGENKPNVGPGLDLSNDDVAMLNNADVKNFLLEKFNLGYLTQAFSKSDAPEIKKHFDDVEGYETKLNYFWKGTDDKCFAKDKGYNLASAAMTDSAFISCVPELKPYLEDEPDAWAVKLFKYCTTPFTLAGLALQNTLDGRKRLTQLCSILHALDPKDSVELKSGEKITYSTALYLKVTNYRLGEVMGNYTASDKQEYQEFLTEFMKQYIETMINGGGSWSDEIRAKAKDEIQNLMDEYKTDSVKALTDALESIIADSLDTLLDLGKLPVADRINTFLNKNPKLKNIARGMTIALYGLGAYLSIKTLFKWDTLEKQEKIAAVAGTVDIVANIFNDVSKWMAVDKVASAESTMENLIKADQSINEALRGGEIIESAEKAVVELDEEMAGVKIPGLSKAGEVAGAAVAEAEGGVEAVSSVWTKISRVSDMFAKGMTIIAMGAACVCTAFEVAKDFATGQPTALKVFDILETVANGIAFLAEAGAGIAGLLGIEVCSVVPVIGVVAAVAGIVFAFVTLFIHRKPTKSPQEVYVENQCIPFLKMLNNPPQKWLDDQKKLDNHLNGAPAVS
ncbi:MAG: hypothetical protein K6F51_13465 [Acetatifactor sp.]|nr:hypothetical protein [Acetatifactor sp.]